MKNLFFRIKNILNPPVLISDEYLDWLFRANAGMQNPGNLFCFKHAIDNLKSESPVVEIGAFCGLSTNIITYLLKKAGRNNQVITVDNWMYEGFKGNKKVGDSHMSHEDFKGYAKDSFIRNIKSFSPYNLPYAIEKNSDEFFNLWEKDSEIKDVLDRPVKLGGAISFCFVDGNHSFEYVKRDFVNVDKYLEKGGFVLFDDSYEPEFVDVPKLMKEVLKNPAYELVARNPNYLFRKR